MDRGRGTPAHRRVTPLTHDGDSLNNLAAQRLTTSFDTEPLDQCVKKVKDEK
jgi:hypothetical protein